MAKYAHSVNGTVAAERPDSPVVYRVVAYLAVAVLLIVGLYYAIPALITGSRAPVRLVVYGFSTQEDVFSRGIFPAFEAAWEAETGRDLEIEGVFGASGTLANQITLGAPADVAVFSNAQHVAWLKAARLVNQATPAAIIGSTPMVIVVRPGNPDGVHDFADLAQPGVDLLMAEPEHSGAGDWTVLAEYGSAYLPEGDRSAAEALLEAVWGNVKALGTSARATLTLFELGAGDALVTYEQDARLAQDRGALLEVVLPPRTIVAQHVAVVIDANVTPAERRAAAEFVHFLVSDEGQEIMTRYHLRAPETGILGVASDFQPFTVEELGGWSPAYHDLIEGFWQRYVATHQAIDSLPTLLNGQD